MQSLNVQRGAVPLIALVVIVGLVAVLLITNTFSFQQGIFSNLFPKPLSKADTTISNDNLAILAFIHLHYQMGAKQYLFDAAKRTNKKLIRQDFPMTFLQPQEGVFSWTKQDENVNLAAQNGLEIVGVLGWTGLWIASGSDNGPIDSDKYDKWATHVSTVVGHYPQVKYWEIWNEPNVPGFFGGTASDYARTLFVAYDAVKLANPTAKVLFGGVVHTGYFDGWVNTVMTDPTYPGVNKFDIANVHIRGDFNCSPQGCPKIDQQIANIRNGLNQNGRSDAPLWITEHGYPADPAYQTDINFKGTSTASGELAQADYYAFGLPKLIEAGAEKIFVTLRDYALNDNNGVCSPQGPGSPFCSEGMVTFAQTSSTSGTDKPAMITFQNLGESSASALPSPTFSPTSQPSNSPLPTPLKGDANSSGRVDVFDYNILMLDFGQQGSNLRADFNGNGKVDVFDYNLLMINFGRTN